MFNPQDIIGMTITFLIGILVLSALIAGSAGAIYFYGIWKRAKERH